MEDDSGQFLLLTSVVVAIGLVVLLVFINQSSMSGYSSSESIMIFPKDNVRDFRAEMISEAQQIAYNENNKNDLLISGTRQSEFSSSFDSSINDIKTLYAQRGVSVDVQYTTMIDPTNDPVYPKLMNTTLNLVYNDGETLYNENYVVDLGGYQ